MRRQHLVNVAAPGTTQITRSILIVDDDEDVRDALRDALQFEGLSVEVAHNGQEAVERLRVQGHAPWLVLLDLTMPVMDGRTFLGVRARDAALASIPVIVLTAGSDCREVEATQDISCCLPKTVLLPELMAAISTYS